MLFKFAFPVLLLSVSPVTHAQEEFDIIDAEEAGYREKRSPRQLQETVVLTQDEKDGILSLHNQFRSQAASSNMLAMSWDDDIARFASSYISNCEFEHSSSSDRSSIAGFRVIGENLGARISSSSSKSRSFILSVSQSWHNEISDYRYEQFTCRSGKACGHYTQIVWANTYKIGCGAAFCDRDSSSRGYRLLVSCNYGPAGNFRNSTARPSRTGRPFERNGPPCAECPQGDTCVNNLCMNAARGDVIPATSTQPPRSTTQPPRSTTQPPRSTTQPPRSTTQPPSSSTTRPTSPTSSPPTSTYPPPVTDTPYTTSSATSTMGTTTANPNAGRCNIYREYTQALVAYRTEITKWTRQFQAWKKAQSYSNN